MVKVGIIITIIIVLALGGFFVLRKNGGPSYTTAEVKRQDLVQEVSVTGRVKPAENVSLAFKTGGRVSRIHAAVGQKVEANQNVIELENVQIASELLQAQANLRAQRALFTQYQASLEYQEAKLEELKRGARKEEVHVAEAKLESARVALRDAEITLANTESKSTSDLNTLYSNVPNILNDAYVKADDAVNKQVDDLFLNDNTSVPALTFDTNDTQARSDVTSKRVLSGIALSEIKSTIQTLSSLQSGRDTALTFVRSKLVVIQDMLSRLTDALNAALGLSSTTLSTYKASVNSARTNLNVAISAVDAHIQSIASQKVTNQNNIDAAQKSLNAATNAVALAEQELLLIQAGATSEQIASQEAQVRQARATVESQGARIQEAQASIQTIEARLGDTMLKAPFAGTITQQNVKIGEVISANQEVVSLISEAVFEIETFISETDIAKIQREYEAELTLDAYGSETTFKAYVTHIDPAETVVEGVSTYKVKLQFREHDERIKSGMTANITIVTEKRIGALAVPQRAVITRNGQKVVRKVNGNVLEDVRVETGIRDSDGNIEIVSGVDEGTVVAIGGE